MAIENSEKLISTFREMVTGREVLYVKRGSGKKIYVENISPSEQRSLANQMERFSSSWAHPVANINLFERQRYGDWEDYISKFDKVGPDYEGAQGLVQLAAEIELGLMLTRDFYIGTHIRPEYSVELATKTLIENAIWIAGSYQAAPLVFIFQRCNTKPEAMSWINNFLEKLDADDRLRYRPNRIFFWDKNGRYY